MPTVAEFLIERISNTGIKHVFGVSGEYTSKFCKKLQNNELKFISTVNESGAAFAADAYARLNGFGCVSMTNSGSLKALDAIAGAFAERSPVLIVCGGPPKNEISNHTMNSYDCYKSIFDNFTCFSVVLDDPTKAGLQIDKAIEALKYFKQPVYLELPCDIAEKPIAYDVYKLGTPDGPKSDVQNLEEATEEAIKWISASQRPVILAGVEIARFDLGESLIKFASKANIPIVTTLLSKSIISEQHPLYLGNYCGKSSQVGVKEAVDESDCLIILGLVPGDSAVGDLPLKFKKKNVICCTVEEMNIKNHTFGQVRFNDFVQALFKADIVAKQEAARSCIVKTRIRFVAQHNSKLTISRLFDKINSILTKDLVVIADAGNSLYGASDLVMPNEHSFLGGAIHCGMGTSIPGALGAELAKPNLRPLVFIGDGSFQGSLSELSTIVANKLNPIVVILNNGCYAKEKARYNYPFNKVNNWNYERVIDMIGGGKGILTETEEQFDCAINEALDSVGLQIINAVISADDLAPALKRLLEKK